MTYPTLLVTMANAIVLVVGLPVAAATVAASAIAPKQDPWYTAPSGYALVAPGQVLRTRVVPGNLTRANSNSSAAYNILYRTADSTNKVIWVVTTLVILVAETEVSKVVHCYPTKFPMIRPT